MRNDIREKLRIELNKEIENEPQVIYILSRIRKILEIDNEKKYKILKFYCDWALHAEIENTDSIKDLLKGVVVGDDRTLMDFFLFKPFHQDFRLFLKENNLSTAIPDSNPLKQRFNIFLSQIYTDTPLIIKSIKRTRIIWKGIPSGGEYSYGGSFKIEDEP